MLCNYSHFFFLYQQFITWRAVADCGSNYIATYMQSKLTSRYKRKDKGKRERKNQKTQRKQKIVTEIIQRRKLLG